MITGASTSRGGQRRFGAAPELARDEVLDDVADVPASRWRRLRRQRRHLSDGNDGSDGSDGGGFSSGGYGGGGYGDGSHCGDIGTGPRAAYAAERGESALVALHARDVKRYTRGDIGAVGEVSRAELEMWNEGDAAALESALTCSSSSSAWK